MERNSKPKNHHYVPQAYLKNFSNENSNNEYQINVIDKNKDKLYKTNIRNVSCEKNYNRVENLKDPNYWEEYYSKTIENKINKFLKNLIASAMLTINNKEIFNQKIKEDFCEIIISQTYRTKKNREHLMKYGEKFLIKKTKELADTIKGQVSKEAEEYIRNWEPDYDFLKGETLKIINDKRLYEKIKKGLLEKNWILYRNKNYKSMPFITSDNPVHIYNYRNPEKQTGNSLIAENVIIYFPISEMLMLAIFPQYIYGKNMNYINNKIEDMDDNNFIIRLYNRFYQSCSRQIYYKI